MKFLFFLLLCVAAFSGSNSSVMVVSPHVASVMTDMTTFHKCNAFFVALGDGLVSESRTLITTASCVFGGNRQYILGVGDHIIGNSEFLNVEKIYIHPNYSKNPDMYDIAILITDKAARGVKVFHLLNNTDYYGVSGTLRLWRYVGEKYELTDNTLLYVNEDYYEKATNVPLRESEIAVMSSSPLTNGYYDLGTPFTFDYWVSKREDLGRDVEHVIGFLGKPRLEVEARFFALNSIPFYYSWIYSTLIPILG